MQFRSEFLSPCQLGDHLVLEFAVVDLGRSSLTHSIRGRVGDEEKLRARHKIAMISLVSYRAVPIPDDLRVGMEPYRGEPADQPPEVAPA